jgi:hypothetical protein
LKQRSPSSLLLNQVNALPSLHTPGCNLLFSAVDDDYGLLSKKTKNTVEQKDDQKTVKLDVETVCLPVCLRQFLGKHRITHRAHHSEGENPRGAAQVWLPFDLGDLCELSFVRAKRVELIFF